MLVFEKTKNYTSKGEKCNEIILSKFGYEGEILI